MVASGQGDLPMVELLLKYGADPGRRTPQGSTAERFARREGHAAVASVLEKAARKP